MLSWPFHLTTISTHRTMACKIFIDLPTGQKMPALGFGTWQASEEEITQAVESALEAGYRHIDCAPVYENEAAIGRVLKKWLDSGRVTREELFIVTKLPPVGTRPGPEGPDKWIKKSLSDLQLDYLDVYLIHTPFTFVNDNDNHHPFDDQGRIRFEKNTDHVKIWADMEKLVDAGRTKAIGLSNFNVDQISRVLDIARHPVANLQIELHVDFPQDSLVNYCKSKGIAVTAYSPLGSPGLVKRMNNEDCVLNIMEDVHIVKIAEKHKKSPAQVALRYIVQRGIAAIPKSVKPERIRSNIDIFDFKLDEEDFERIKIIDQGPHGRICDFSFLKGINEHPQFPFERL